MVVEVAAAADSDDESSVVDLLFAELIDRSHLHLPDLRRTEREGGIEDDDGAHDQCHHCRPEPDQGTSEHGPAALAR